MQPKSHNSPVIEVRRENWRIDADGMMRVTANILKHGVFPYAVEDGADIPDEVRANIGDRDTVYEFINLDTLTDDVISTLEGKPIIADAHWWQKVDGGDLTDEEREILEKGEAIRIGNVAGKPYVIEEGGEKFLRTDFLIDHKQAIKRIQDRDLIENSAGYASVIHPEPGVCGKDKYDVEQKITRFNHVAALKIGQGRCGRDVRILNTKNKEENMSVIINRQVGNTVERYTFNSEDDAREAERMADAVVGVLEVQRKNAMEEIEKKENELGDLTQANEELVEVKGNLEARVAELEAKMEKLLALEVKDQQEGETIIIEEELNEADAKEVAKEVEKENSLGGRRKKVVEAIARMNGLDASGWSQEAVDAQFQLLGAKARKAREVKESAAPRSSEIKTIDSCFKRQNASGEGNKAQRAAKARQEAGKSK